MLDFGQTLFKGSVLHVLSFCQHLRKEPWNGRIEFRLSTCTSSVTVALYYVLIINSSA